MSDERTQGPSEPRSFRDDSVGSENEAGDYVFSDAEINVSDPTSVETPPAAVDSELAPKLVKEKKVGKKRGPYRKTLIKRGLLPGHNARPRHYAATDGVQHYASLSTLGSPDLRKGDRPFQPRLPSTTETCALYSPIAGYMPVASTRSGSAYATSAFISETSSFFNTHTFPKLLAMAADLPARSAVLKDLDSMLLAESAARDRVEGTRKRSFELFMDDLSGISLSQWRRSKRAKPTAAPASESAPEIKHEDGEADELLAPSPPHPRRRERRIREPIQSAEIDGPVYGPLALRVFHVDDTFEDREAAKRTITPHLGWPRHHWRTDKTDASRWVMKCSLDDCLFIIRLNPVRETPLHSRWIIKKMRQHTCTLAQQQWPFPDPGNQAREDGVESNSGAMMDDSHMDATTRTKLSGIPKIPRLKETFYDRQPPEVTLSFEETQGVIELTNTAKTPLTAHQKARPKRALTRSTSVASRRKPAAPTRLAPGNDLVVFSMQLAPSADSIAPRKIDLEALARRCRTAQRTKDTQDTATNGASRAQRQPNGVSLRRNLLQGGYFR